MVGPAESNKSLPSTVFVFWKVFLYTRFKAELNSCLLRLSTFCFY